VVLLFLGEYATSPKGLKVNDRVRVDVDVQRLEELQRQRDAWDPELAKVRVFTRDSWPEISDIVPHGPKMYRCWRFVRPADVCPSVRPYVCMSVHLQKVSPMNSAIVL